MTIQELQFELIKKASFNNFDAENVVADLTAYKEFWRGAVMDRPNYCINHASGAEMVDLIKLRDIEHDQWNVDTLYILAKEGKEQELESLARGWGADEIDWIGGREAQNMLGGMFGNEPKILRVWWD